MSVIVAHPSLNRSGGAERVCLAIIKTLNARGYKVRLATVDKTDWPFLEERFGKLDRPSKETFLMDWMPAESRASQAIFTSSFFIPLLVHLRTRHQYDALVNTCGDMIDSIADMSYVNSVPVRIAHYYSDAEFSRSMTWRSAAQTYNLSLHFADRIFGNGILLTNSRFMQSVIRNTLGRHSTIVYPPVDLTRFRQAKSKERKNLVVAVSRIRPGKHLEIIPQLAKVVKKARFVIVGIADPASWDTIKMLTETVSNLRVGDRVELLVNEPLDKLVDILLSSKVFLHAQPMEAFGMAVIEAMATGCVPIVPRNGGPWYDILNAEEGNYGYSYTNIGDAANLINMLLNDERLRTEVSLRAQRRTLYFENSNFEEKILALVGKICAGV